MDDEGLLARIKALADQEHELHQAHGAGGLTDDQRAELHEVEVGLDQCWDLLRQRRALRDAGRDPDAADVRGEQTVEGYQQ